MTFLPIVNRELRVASRKRATYWVRTTAGLVVVALGLWLFLVMQNEPPHELASGLFYILTGSAVFYALLSGVRTTADCLSEEKREGTLGLLFLTDLKGYDVVLGKLIACSVNAFYAVVAVLPMLAIPLLMGGVTLGEFARMSLLAINALFFSLAAGMCVSAFSRSPIRAMLGALLLIMFFTAVLPAWGSWHFLAGNSPAVRKAFLLPSVGFAYHAALDSVFRTNAQPFWVSMVTVHLLGWILLLAASALAPHVWRDRPASRRKVGWTARWKLWSYGSTVERAAFRRRLLEVNPFFWLAARVRVKPALLWGFLALVGCIWIWGLAKNRVAWSEPGMFLMTGLFVNAVLRCWFAAEATRQLAEDRKQGTLELLLSTPLSVPEILRGQRLALARQFLGPVLVVLAIECLFMLGSLPNIPLQGDSLFFWVYPAGMVMLVLDLCALYWVGLWQSLSARSQSRALSGSLARILVVPWVLIALVVLILALAALGNRNTPDPGGSFFLGLWFGVGVLVDLCFAGVARHHLHRRFRLAAQERYGTPAGFWKKFFAAGS